MQFSLFKAVLTIPKLFQNFLKIYLYIFFFWKTFWCDYFDMRFTYLSLNYFVKDLLKKTFTIFVSQAGRKSPWKEKQAKANKQLWIREISIGKSMWVLWFFHVQKKQNGNNNSNNSPPRKSKKKKTSVRMLKKNTSPSRSGSLIQWSLSMWYFFHGQWRMQKSEK